MIRSALRTAALAAATALAACATPLVQSPMTPPPGFAGPAVEGDALIMDDGARLPLARWAPTSGQPPTAVILALHGVNDSRASFRLAGAWWAEQGVETWAYDERGFGEAPGKGVWPGEARMTQDLRVAVRLARAAHPGVPLFVAGESMGGAVAISAFASDDPPDADGVILMGPAVWGWSSQDPLNRYSLRLAAGLMGDKTIEPPSWIVRERLASDNMVELYRTGRDPASIIAPRFDALYGLVDLMESATVKLGQVRAPTLLMYGGRDNVVQKRPMRLALERAGDRPGFRTAYYPNGWHILNRDLQAEVIYRDALAWVRDSAAPLPSGAGPVLPALGDEKAAD
ncbi:alpha/beta fold hydrolase [Brevundimonas sp. NPDC092305]|uniref:alpha/beta fold hydrolase n=1 Tax=Brevundimonas sp. NPDC092305 TaxID=3363957 RepID=UPI0037F20D7F